MSWVLVFILWGEKKTQTQVCDLNVIVVEVSFCLWKIPASNYLTQRYTMCKILLKLNVFVSHSEENDGSWKICTPEK